MTQQPPRRDATRPDTEDPDPADLPPPQAHRTRIGPAGHKATQFDGNPDQQPAEDAPSGLSPRDDTPAVLKKDKRPRSS